MRPVLVSALVSALVHASCASAPDPVAPGDAANTAPPAELVRAHLRAIEAGEFERAEAMLDPAFTMQMKGMPFFAKIARPRALDMHRARKQAFPDFRFNEKVVEERGNSVKVAVFLTGTHTGYLDYPIADVPKLAATGRRIDLPAEYFTYFVERDRIRAIFGEIPEGSGPPALKKQLGVE